MLRCHFDEIAEHIVVLDPEDANSGILGVPCLQRRDDPARLVPERARLVESLVIAFADESAVTLEGRQLGGERSRQFGGQHAIWLAARLHRDLLSRRACL